MNSTTAAETPSDSALAMAFAAGRTIASWNDSPGVWASVSESAGLLAGCNSSLSV